MELRPGGTRARRHVCLTALRVPSLIPFHTGRLPSAAAGRLPAAAVPAAAVPAAAAAGACACVICRAPPGFTCSSRLALHRFQGNISSAAAGNVPTAAGNVPTATGNVPPTAGNIPAAAAGSLPAVTAAGEAAPILARSIQNCRRGGLLRRALLLSLTRTIATRLPPPQQYPPTSAAGTMRFFSLSLAQPIPVLCRARCRSLPVPRGADSRARPRPHRGSSPTTQARPMHPRATTIQSARRHKSSGLACA